MTSFNQIGPWITVGLLFAIIVFFCLFYIVRLLKIKKTSVDEKAVISSEQKDKLKEDILHDIVADITPVLKKRLEKAF